MPVDLVDTFDIEASRLAVGRQNAAGALKIWEDLWRYQAIIQATKPEVVVECGTHQGMSALWFARQGVDVVTIDIGACNASDSRITKLVGDSTNPSIFAQVAILVGGRKTMVVLDSDHRGAHVRKEIGLYGSLVTLGCYLVVEDGIVRYLTPHGWAEGQPGPLEAIEELLVDIPAWVRDREIESMHPVTMSPVGWWRRAQ
jgi:cephalosporin hydroxylase